jgi:2-polyprenyl-6-hydroxyphenyl methylase/3-demethylubiquinone-9 3-methyltransferase
MQPVLTRCQVSVQPRLPLICEIQRQLRQRMTALKANGRWQEAQRHELRWWERYLSAKDRVAYANWKLNYWRGILGKVPVSLLPEAGSSILDAGCGPAGIFMALAQYKVIAVDPLLRAYEASDLLRREVFPWTTFISSPLEDFGRPQLDQGHPFDAVFSMNMLNHVHDIGICLSRLWELTAPKGSLVITVDTHRSVLLKHLFRILPVDRLHPHQHSLREYLQMLWRSGFSVRFSEPLWKRGPMAHWLVAAVKNGGSGT